MRILFRFLFKQKPFDGSLFASKLSQLFFMLWNPRTLWSSNRSSAEERSFIVSRNKSQESSSSYQMSQVDWMISIRPTTTWKVSWIYRSIFSTFLIGIFCLLSRTYFRAWGQMISIRLRLSPWWRKYTKITTSFLTTTFPMVVAYFSFLLIFVAFKIALFTSTVNLSFLLIRLLVWLMITNTLAQIMFTKTMPRQRFITCFLGNRF